MRGVAHDLPAEAGLDSVCDQHLPGSGPKACWSLLLRSRCRSNAYAGSRHHIDASRIAVRHAQDGLAWCMVSEAQHSGRILRPPARREKHSVGVRVFLYG